MATLYKKIRYFTSADIEVAPHQGKILVQWIERTMLV
jgi:hypothetical protein